MLGLIARTLDYDQRPEPGHFEASRDWYHHQANATHGIITAALAGEMDLSFALRQLRQHLAERKAR